jgi:hypothetical protein
VLHVEGEVVELIPSRTKPQGIAKIKWTTYNQRGESGIHQPKYSYGREAQHRQKARLRVF